MPAGRLDRAISTPSSGCRRMTGAGGMKRSPWSWRVARWRIANGEERMEDAGGYSLFATPYSPFAASSRLAAAFLAGLVDLHFGVGRHQAALVRQGHELESHVDRPHRAVGAGAVDAGIEAALAAFLDDLLVDLENFRLVAVEFRHQPIGEAEVAWADIDAVDALDVEDRFHVPDRRLGFHHRQQHDFFIGGLLVGTGRAVHARADRAVRAGATRRIFGILDQGFRLFLGVDHRANHAIGAAVEHLADDTGLVPGHADHRGHRVAVHRLEALHHRLIVLHAMLHVDGDAVEAALRDHLGGKPGWNRKPGVHHGLARGPNLLHVVCHWSRFPLLFVGVIRVS